MFQHFILGPTTKGHESKNAGVCCQQLQSKGKSWCQKSKELFKAVLRSKLFVSALLSLQAFEIVMVTQ